MPPAAGSISVQVACLSAREDHGWGFASLLCTARDPGRPQPHARRITVGELDAGGFQGGADGGKGG